MTTTTDPDDFAGTTWHSDHARELTALHVSAFVRNMKFGRLDAGLANLESINKIIDTTANGTNGAT